MNKLVYFKHLVRVAQIAEELQTTEPEASEELDAALGSAPVEPGTEDTFPPVETPSAKEEPPAAEGVQKDPLIDEVEREAAILAEAIMGLEDFISLTEDEITEDDLAKIEALIEREVAKKIND